MATQTSPNINAERIKGHLQLSASTTASSQLNLIQGTAPVSPVAGDIYRTSSHIVIYNHLAIENSGTGALRIGNVGNTNARDLSIYRNANSVVGFAIENNTAGAANSVNINFGNSSTNGFGNANISRYDYANSSTYTGTSVVAGDSFVVGNFVGNGGALGSSNIVFKDSAIIGLTGGTATNYGFRLDTTGLRIGQLSTLHTANTDPFQIFDLTFVANNIIYGGPSDESFMQLHTTLAQIGHYSTRAQYYQNSLYTYVAGVEVINLSSTLSTFRTAVRLDNLAGTGSRIVQADADGDLSATEPASSLYAAKVFAYNSFI